MHGRQGTADATESVPPVAASCAATKETSFARQRKIPDSPKRDFSPVPASCPQRTRTARTKRSISHPFYMAQVGFSRFCQSRLCLQPSWNADTPSSLPKLPVGKPLTMRMVKGIPCSCHGEFWLAHGIRDAGFDVPYSLYIGRCRLMATSFRFRPQAPAIPKWDSPCPHSQTPLSSRSFDTIVCIN